MKKNILNLLIVSIVLLSAQCGSYAAPCEENLIPNDKQEIKNPPRPSSKEIKQIDKMLEERLKLTPEQIKILKTNKQKNIKELEKTIAKMESIRKKIRNIYMLGLPAYQADIKSAPYKMELVILKQNADNIRKQNRKTFESILTTEQKEEFKKIRSEFPRRPR